jgi:protein tyrosine phosphatase
MESKFEDVNIRSEVYFNSAPSQSNRDLFWKVIHKYEDEKRLVVQLDEMAYSNVRWTIGFKDVGQHLKLNKDK